MAAARRAVEAGLAARDAARIKVRQPLRLAALPGAELLEEISAIVREELNVKALTFGAPEVQLDTEIDHELRLEGLARDLVRGIQNSRKELGLNIEDRIVLYYQATGLAAEAFREFGGRIGSETLATELLEERLDAEGTALKMEGSEVWIWLRKSG